MGQPSDIILLEDGSAEKSVCLSFRGFRLGPILAERLGSLERLNL